MKKNTDGKVALHMSLIEVTRRCNLKCKHCMRGEPQNITIKKEYIDKYFDSLKGIMNINLTGGEPLLALDECEYIIDKIVKENFSMQGFAIVTNGTVLDKRVADMFNKIHSYMMERWEWAKEEAHVSLIISNSEFHNNNPQKAYDFYKPLLNDGISLEFRSGDSSTSHMNGLVRQGRAKDLSAKDYNFDEAPPLHRVFYYGDASIKDVDTIKEHNPEQNIFIAEMVYPCIQLCSNGLVEICRPVSFEEEDKTAMGNIMDMTVLEMIEKWNKKYLFTRREAALIQKYEEKLIYEKETTQKEVRAIIDWVADTRRECIEKIPYLTFSEICMLVFAVYQLKSGHSHPLDVNNFTDEECRNVVQNMENWNKERAIENGDISQGLPYMEQMGLSGLLISGLMGLVNLLGKKR